MANLNPKNSVKLIRPETFENPLCAEIGTSFFYMDDDDDDTVDPASKNISYAIAIDTCKKCSHVNECAEWGIHREKWGVWGGLTPPQRVQIRRRHRLRLDEPQ